MKYAIFESGGKQFKAVEGATLEVDRLPVIAGEMIDIDRVLLMVDGDEIQVGTPLVAGHQVKVSVVDHVKGPKILTFRYSPKKRIRVRIGHRQQYTRLLVEYVGKAGGYSPKPKVTAVEAETELVEAKPAKKAEKAPAKKAAPAKKPAEKKPAAKKPAEKTPAKKAAPAKKPAAKKPAEKKPAAKKPAEKKPAAKKPAAKK